MIEQVFYIFLSLPIAWYVINLNNPNKYVNKKGQYDIPHSVILLVTFFLSIVGLLTTNWVIFLIISIIMMVKTKKINTFNFKNSTLLFLYLTIIMNNFFYKIDFNELFMNFLK